VKRVTAVIAGLALGVTTGCSSMVQVPRAEFAAESNRKNILVRTQAGEQFAFDQATFSADSLVGVGYQQRTVILADGQPSVEEVATRVSVSLDQVTTLTEKRRDWGRTAKWGLGIAAAGAFVAAVGLSKPEDDGAQPGGGKGPPEL
jgi:hypothetical protein